MLHLDLKPENVVVDEGDRPVLLDLGSALPVNAGPEEAGGTPGYAAPEVVGGEAPTAASDVHGLGAVLYELLTGVRARGGTSEGSRRALLAEHPLPVRVVAPATPRTLARLVEDMLARDPLARPGSVDEVRERLADAGFPMDPAVRGSPGFVAREIELEALRDELAAGEGCVVAIVGAAGSGRSRLARRGAAELGRRLVDLGAAPHRAEALYRLLRACDPATPPRRPGWWSTYRPAPGSAAELTVFLGRRETLPERDLQEVQGGAERLAGAGAIAIWAAAEVLPGVPSVPVAPMSPTELARVARELGATDPEAAIEGARGAPGPLVEGLIVADERSRGLPSAVAAAHAALASLPMPIPAAALALLGRPARAELAHLLSRGLARREPEGAITTLGAKPGPVPEAWRATVAAMVHDPTVPAPWAAVAAVRCGASERARALFDGAAGSLARRSRVEVLEHLVGNGARDLLAAFGEVLLLAARPAEAAAALDVPDADATERALRARALRGADRLDEARGVLEAALAEGDHPALLAELTRLEVALVRWAEARAALDRAAASGLDPASLTTAAIAVTAAQSLHAHDTSQLVAALDAAGQDLDPDVLTVAGKSLLLGHAWEAAAVTLRRALARADAAEDWSLANRIRATLGRAVLQLGRSAEARQLYTDALCVATAQGDRHSYRAACYELCVLERACGRRAAAERYLALWDRSVAGDDHPHLRARGAMLRAGLAEARGDPRGVIEALADAPSSGPLFLAARSAFLASAELALGDPEAALAHLDAHPSTPHSEGETLVVRGRAHLAIARRHLARAAAHLPPGEPDQAMRGETGEALLAAAGEDLDPATFPARIASLGRAAELLHGAAAARAAALRDRFAGGTGAGLESLVQLAEAVQEPEHFPAAIARSVAEALGVRRVVVVVRMPGFGRHVIQRELGSGEEAAGIVAEVTGRLRAPDDVWLADDAFADPELRAASATVRRFAIKSVMAVAISDGDAVIGAIYVDDPARPARFGAREVELLRRLARAIGRMIVGFSGIAGSATVEPEDVHGVLLGDREQIRGVRDTLAFLRGQSAVNLLVTGPTGAGKTWFARRVATEVLGVRGLLEVVLRRTESDKLVAQLAGTRKGDFSGAVDAVGLVHRALRERKALFLDEVHALDDEGQQALLPLLELPMRRFGGLAERTDALSGPLHVILGTNAPVAGEAWTDHFREDLWWRIAQHQVHLPPLADRGPAVVRRYLEQMSPSPVAEVFAPDALRVVLGHGWPGNLRMLEAFARKAASLRAQASRPLTVADLPRAGLEVHAEPARPIGLDALTSQAVEAALKESRWNQREAAERLGITRFRLLRLLKSSGLLDEVRRLRAEESRAGKAPRGQPGDGRG